jgi:hypothetical protein
MKSAAHTAGASVVGRLTDIAPWEAEPRVPFAERTRRIFSGLEQF